MPLPEHAPQQPSTPTARQPMIISHAEMHAAYDQGQATPLGQTIAYITRYQDTWWILFEGGWIRADHDLATMLDVEAARITAQDALIARNTAIRASIGRSSQAEVRNQ